MTRILTAIVFICCRQGFLGIEALLNYFIRVWLQDIKKNQLPSILSGVGPMHAFVQLCKWMIVVWKDVEIKVTFCFFVKFQSKASLICFGCPLSSIRRTGNW